MFKPADLFDLNQTEHAAIFDGCEFAWEALAKIKGYLAANLRPALHKASITKPFRPFHDLRHTALTHEAAAGNPLSYIQLKAGHSQTSITERYIHAAQVQFTGMAARAEARMFGAR